MAGVTLQIAPDDVEGLLTALSGSYDCSGPVVVELLGKFYEFELYSSELETYSAVLISSNVEIIVKGCKPQTTIKRANGPSKFRLFHIAQKARVTMLDVRIENGLIEGSFGGGILSEGVLGLERCVISNCCVLGLDGESINFPADKMGAGGAQAGMGGALFANGKTTLNDCTFEHCRADGGRGGSVDVYDPEYYDESWPWSEGTGGGVGGGRSLPEESEGLPGTFSCGGGGGRCLGTGRGGKGGFGGGDGGWNTMERSFSCSSPQLVKHMEAAERSCLQLGGEGGIVTSFAGPGGGGAALGGAIFLLEGECDIVNCVFTENVASAGDSGAFRFRFHLEEEEPRGPEKLEGDWEFRGSGRSIGACLFSLNCNVRLSNIVSARNATFSRRLEILPLGPDRKFADTCAVYTLEEAFPICKNFKDKFAEATNLPALIVEKILFEYLEWPRRRRVAWREVDRKHTSSHNEEIRELYRLSELQYDDEVEDQNEYSDEDSIEQLLEQHLVEEDFSLGSSESWRSDSYHADYDVD